jgi:glucose-6-phosphate 1-dehydrogenase
VTAGTEPNPLGAGLHESRMAEPALMVIFGATGDLAKRKLLPSIYNLARQRLLPPGFAVVGAAMDDLSEEAFRERAKQSVTEFSRTQPIDEEVLKSFLENLYYVPVKFDDGAAFKRLKSRLDELDHQRHTGGNVVFYCAVPPPVYPLLVNQLDKNGLAKEARGQRRIIIEKPFGSDLKSARDLNRLLQHVFREDNVYRIDHYLGKETVQNIMVFRFANSIFEPIWSCQFVDHVQITVAEELGVEGRGGYYDRAGALRDVVQNHALQLVALTAMEPPVAFDAQSVRDEKVKVLRAIRPLAVEEMPRVTVRGQYTEGYVLGQKVPGYREEPSVDPKSETETFAAVKLQVDNWRWADVPFYVRSGKRMPKRVTEIRIQFKRPPHLTFGREQLLETEPNTLILRIQPEEGISLKFSAKVPSGGIRLRTVNMDFLYLSSFVADAPDAYERLLVDCMLGDPTLFTRADEVEQAWVFIDPIEESWRRGQPPLEFYKAGTWGPAGADRLLEADGRKWAMP